MSYPGDPSIPPEIQQRIYQTFRQAVELAIKGSRQEALLGCDFVLRLDPRFDLARQLADRLQRGTSPEALQELLRRLPTSEQPKPTLAQAAAAPPPDLRELESLSLEVPEASPPDSADLEEKFESLQRERKWSELLELARLEERRVASHPRLRKLAEEALSHLEAEPYVRSFLASAREARARGELEELERLLRKVRALDPTHPDLLAFEQEALEAEKAPSRDESLELPEIDLSAPLGLESGFELDPLGGPPPVAPSAPSGTADRITQLLEEGQRAFDRGELQAAIDAWSRIFLIDIDHAEAARRIEVARQLKAEKERQVEELFHEAVQKFDQKRFPEAKELFRRVLELSPGYALAEEYLVRLEAGPEEVQESGSPLSAAPVPAPPASQASAHASTTLSQEILIPPDPEELAAAEGAPLEAPREFAVAAKSSARVGFPSPKFLAIGAAALVLLVGAGWFLLTRWSKFFPNARSEAQQPVGPSGAERLSQAQKLHQAGQIAQAIAELKRIPAQDPAAVEAQLLIGQWERQLAEAKQPALSPTQANRRRFLIEAAREAVAAGRVVEARTLLLRARALAPLDGEANQLLGQISEALKPYAEEVRILEQEDFEYAANLLWRKRQQGGSNPILDRLLVTAYFNLGVNDLKQGDPLRAAERFQEAQVLAGRSDEELDRVQRFAQAYRQKPQDLLYRVFVSQLELR